VPITVLDRVFRLKGEIVDAPNGQVDGVPRSGVRANTDFQNEYDNPNSW
jgi:hypothetical protein